MTDARQKAIEALRPFAALADKLDAGDGRGPHDPLRKPGLALLGIGDVAITTDDLRRARKTLAELEGEGGTG